MFPMSHQKWAIVATLDVNETSMPPIAQLCIHVSMGVKQYRAVDSMCRIANITWLNSPVCWCM